MAIHFLADVHLTTEADDVNARRLAGYLAGPARDAEALYVLGDLFDLWLGDDGSLETHAAVLDAFAACIESGVPGYFLRGNHDFAVGEAFVARSRLLIVDDPAVVEVDGASIVLSHGDALCTDDVAHQLFRSRYTDPLWRARMQRLPLWSRRVLARLFRGRPRSGRTEPGRRGVDVHPEAVARVLSAHRARCLIHGHTHRPADHALTIDGRTARRHVLADWRAESAEILLVDGHGARRGALDVDGAWL